MEMLTQNTPLQTTALEPGRKQSIIIATLILVIIATVTASVTLMQWQQQRITTLNQQVTGLQKAPAVTPTYSEIEAVVPTVAVSSVPTPTLRVKLYYKDSKKDPSVLNCSADTFVYRDIPLTKTPLKDTLTLLLSNVLTTEEKAKGLSGQLVPDASNTDLVTRQKQFSLTSVALSNGTATVSFSDAGMFTSGGSCRVGIMLSQITETAKQFSTVKTVKVLPETLFQP